MIKIEDLCVTAGSFRLDRVSLELAAGAYGVLMGKTGCGKTTLIESVCGLRPIDSGRILLAGKEVSRVRPSERNIGYVPQDGALFPTMTVAKNIAFPLVIRKGSSQEIKKRTQEIADELGIAVLLDRYPARLSGGGDAIDAKEILERQVVLAFLKRQERRVEESLRENMARENMAKADIKESTIE